MWGECEAADCCYQEQGSQSRSVTSRYVLASHSSRSVVLLCAVRQELSVLDRAVLEEEGVELPEGRRKGRGRKRRRREDCQPAPVSSPG